MKDTGWNVHTKTDCTPEIQRKSDFSTNGDSNINNVKSRPVFPKASLLKYEIRHLTNLKQIGDPEHYLSKLKTNKNKTNNNNIKNNSDNNNNNNNNNSNNNNNNSSNNKESEKGEESTKENNNDENMTERIRTSRYTRITDDSIGRSTYRAPRTTLDLDDTMRTNRYRRSWEGTSTDVDSIIRANRLNRRSATGDEITTSHYERPYKRNTEETRSSHRSTTSGLSLRRYTDDVSTVTNGDVSSPATRRLSSRRKNKSSGSDDNEECRKCKEKQERIEKLETDVAKTGTECESKDVQIEKLMAEKMKYFEQCQEKQERITELEIEMKLEKENCEQLSNSINEMQNQLEQLDQFEQLELQLDDLSKERDSFKKEVRKLEKEVKRTNTSLDDEKVQTRRLGIKLEDANYEIGRLRQELITSQLESEKIIEENEDLCVDNEDLIKERDEIIQIYDELFRESERLKHEVKIWKTVFDNNKDNISADGMGGMNDGADNIDEGVELERESSDEEVSVFIDISEGECIFLYINYIELSLEVQQNNTKENARILLHKEVK